MFSFFLKQNSFDLILTAFIFSSFISFNFHPFLPVFPTLSCSFKISPMISESILPWEMLMFNMMKRRKKPMKGMNFRDFASSNNTIQTPAVYLYWSMKKTMRSSWLTTHYSANLLKYMDIGWIPSVSTTWGAFLWLMWICKLLRVNWKQQYIYVST